MLFNLTFYTIVACLCAVLCINRSARAYPSGIAFVTIVTFIWLWSVICFREPAGDPFRYMLDFRTIQQLGLADLPRYERSPIGFTLLNWLCGRLTSQSWFFFSCIYLLCLVPLYHALRLFLGKINGTVALMLYSMYPFYINYLASGFKQGIATGLVLVGIARVLRGEKAGFLWLLAATWFHGSAWMCVAAVGGWVLLRMFSLTRVIPIILLTSLVLGACGLSQPLVEATLPEPILDALGFSSYFDKDFQESSEFLNENIKLGFRWDFAIFTLLPLMLWYANRRVSTGLGGLIGIYALLASLYFMMSFVPYADRIAGFAWALLPIIILKITLDFRRELFSRGVVVGIFATYPLLMAFYMGKYFQ